MAGTARAAKQQKQQSMKTTTCMLMSRTMQLKLVKGWSLLAMKHTCRPKLVKLDGQVYKAPCAVVLSTDDDYPMFGRVDNVNMDVLADVNILETLKFRPHYHCYIVERTVRQKIKSLSCFYNPFPRKSVCSS